MPELNNLQKAINDIGFDTVQRYLPKGMKLSYCEMHGYYLTHYTNPNPLCPICPVPTEGNNGTDATRMYHYIETKQATTPQHNPHQLTEVPRHAFDPPQPIQLSDTDSLEKI